MKAVNVSQLKAHLSHYLRLASRGARIVVKDRNDVIAQIGPPDSTARPWRERLAAEGRLRPGTQDWRKLKISKLTAAVDIQAALQDVRSDHG